LLRGLIFGPTGCAMTPTHTRRRGKLYRYYVSMDVIKQGADACPVRRVPAGEVEAAVIDQVRALIRTPEIVVRTWRAAREEDAAINENDVLEALQRLDPERKHIIFYWVCWFPLRADCQTLPCEAAPQRLRS
jgi:site-specific DNA recombinase